MSLASLTAYGSGSDEASDEEARTTLPRQPPDAALALPAPRQGNAGAAVPPDSKRPRRAFQLPLPSAQASEGESSDDEDAKRFAASRKGGGLLASVSHPAQLAQLARGRRRMSVCRTDRVDWRVSPASSAEECRFPTQFSSSGRLFSVRRRACTEEKPQTDGCSALRKAAACEAGAGDEGLGRK